MKITRSYLKTLHLLGLSIGLANLAKADPILVDPEISITAPSSIRAVAGTTLAPLTFSTTNLNPGSSTAFGLSLSAGSTGSINNLKQPDASVIPGGILTTSAPFTSVGLLAGNTGTISATPNITGILAGQTSTFGLAATNAAWNAPVTSNASIAVVSNRLLTGSVTINAGRHMAGLQPIGNITLNGGALTGSEGTNISINSGGYAQLANGLRLTSASNFTFNGANQTHDLQISYNRPTGAYTITNESLPGVGGTAVNYTDASGAKHQEFGGAWKTSAEYGNVFGAKQVFTEENRNGWDDVSSSAWQRPGTSGYYSNDYIYNQEIAGTSQPSAPTTRYGSPSTWELARGAGSLINERINPLISGEVIQGSSLNLSGVSMTVTGTAVADRNISGGTIDLGRRMVGAAGLTINRSDTVTLSTSGSDEHRTRLNLQALNMDNGSGTTATHIGAAAFTDSAHTASVQLTGNFTLSTATQGTNFQGVNAGASIIGEGLLGENKQSSLQLGYKWNNVINNQLYAVNLLVIDSSTVNGTRSYGTYAGQVYSTETHTNIGWNGNYVQVSGTLVPGIYDLGNSTVTAIAEGLVGENASATAIFNTRYASVAAATFTASNTGAASGSLGEGNVITIRDTGSGIYQNNVSISNVALSGGENLDYQLAYGGGSNLIGHGESRTFTIDYIGNTNAVLAGQLGRVSRADLSIGLYGKVNYSGLVAASGISGGYTVDNSTYGDSLATQNYKLETRFDAPDSPTGSSSVVAGTDLGVNGLSLNNSSANTSSRFVQKTQMELVDSAPLSSAKTVQVEFVKLENASPAVVAALENTSANAASLAGIYGGSGKPEFISDIVNLTGLDNVMQVLQMSYDSTGFNDESGVQLLWQYNYTDAGGAQIAWINSVLGNSNVTALDLLAGTLTVTGSSAATIQDYLTDMRFAGSYAEYLADQGSPNPVLGAWGLDLDANKVWAVIDHNSSFAVSIPEPSVSLLVVFGIAGFAVRRSRR